MADGPCSGGGIEELAQSTQRVLRACGGSFVAYTQCGTSFSSEREIDTERSESLCHIAEEWLLERPGTVCHVKLKVQ